MLITVVWYHVASHIFGFGLAFRGLKCQCMYKESYVQHRKGSENIHIQKLYLVDCFVCIYLGRAVSNLFNRDAETKVEL